MSFSIFQRICTKQVNVFLIHGTKRKTTEIVRTSKKHQSETIHFSGAFGRASKICASVAFGVIMMPKTPENCSAHQDEKKIIQWTVKWTSISLWMGGKYVKGHPNYLYRSHPNSKWLFNLFSISICAYGPYYCWGWVCVWCEDIYQSKINSYAIALNFFVWVDVFFPHISSRNRMIFLHLRIYFTHQTTHAHNALVVFGMVSGHSSAKVSFSSISYSTRNLCWSRCFWVNKTNILIGMYPAHYAQTNTLAPLQIHKHKTIIPSLQSYQQ